MRINVYSQELTDEVLPITKESNTGLVYSAVQFVLHSSPMLHHPPADDDRSAVTFWLPHSADRMEQLAQTFERAAAMVRGASVTTSESLSGGNPGEPKACTPAEERGIVGATGAGQLPDGNPGSTGDSAERRSPAGQLSRQTPDESNRHTHEWLQPDNGTIECWTCGASKGDPDHDPDRPQGWQ